MNVLGFFFPPETRRSIQLRGAELTSPPRPILSPLLSTRGAAMTTSGCCHLPGSLCDCAGNAGLWKNAAERAGGEGCQQLYVAQVTALDGRLLSSVLKPASAQR